jgi:hypothetical protein
MNTVIEQAVKSTYGKKLAIHVCFVDDDTVDVVDSFDGKYIDAAIETYMARIESWSCNNDIDFDAWNFNLTSYTCNAAVVLATHENVPDVIYSLNFVEIN